MKNDFYRFQIKDMKDKRGMGMGSKSDKRGEGLGDINVILGHSLTKHQAAKSQKFLQETQTGGDDDDDFEDIDLEQLADEDYLAKRKA